MVNIEPFFRQLACVPSRVCLLLVLLELGVFILPPQAAKAQTTPTTGENGVGTTCANGANAVDFDTLIQCTSTSSASGTMQKAPVFIGAVTSPPYASTDCDANKAGMLQWTGTALQGCDGTSWIQLN